MKKVLSVLNIIVIVLMSSLCIAASENKAVTVELGMDNRWSDADSRSMEFDVGQTLFLNIWSEKGHMPQGEIRYYLFNEENEDPIMHGVLTTGKETVEHKQIDKKGKYFVKLACSPKGFFNKCIAHAVLSNYRLK